MGRITIFTSDDLHSAQAKLALDSRDLPYLEINLQRYPQKKKDLMTLAGTLAVPQIFFNTRLVGDLKSLMQELKGWDNSAKYKTPRQRFEREILKFPDPINHNLSIPDAEPVTPRELPVRMPASPVRLPDGTTTTVSQGSSGRPAIIKCFLTILLDFKVNDITLKLFNSLPRLEVTIGKTVYSNCFSGEDMRSAFEDSVG